LHIYLYFYLYYIFKDKLKTCLFSSLQSSSELYTECAFAALANLRAINHLIIIIIIIIITFILDGVMVGHG